MRRLAAVLASLAVSAGATIASTPLAPAAAQTPGDPRLTIDAGFATGLNIPWDLDVDAAGNVFFTERAAFTVKVRRTNGQVTTIAAAQPDAWSSGETGLMAIELDPAFGSNRILYTCQGTTDAGNGVQVLRWQVAADLSSMQRISDPLVGGIDGTTGRHGGCQLRFDITGSLLIGTGDAAVGTNPQNLTSLNGKVLRVNPATGAAAAGNPGIPGADPRILTVGHRNVQGLALRPGGQVFSVEHGTACDDEINVLVPGGNFGWNPVPGYDERTPMTNPNVPGARAAVWSSGCPTVAPSGATFLSGSQWGAWDGALAVSFLADQSLRIFRFSNAGALQSITVPAELDGDFGRLRAAESGPDGSLYLTTSNGSNDRIIRIQPVAPATGNPIGNLDVVARVPGGIRLAGWSVDQDAPTQPTEIHAYLGTRARSLGAANLSRPDIAAAVPGAGAAHGFDAVFPVSTASGAVQLCAYAINAAGPGLNPAVGCRTISIRTAPFGNLDVVARVPGGIRVAGWAIDPDVAAGIPVHVYVGAVGTDLGPVTGARPDVGAAFPGYGAAHGFDLVLPAPGSPQRVCAFAFETASTIANPVLGCRTV